MEIAPTCHTCEQREGPFEHAAYVRGPDGERRYVGWLCRDCARQHGTHNRFAAAMVKRGDFVWLVSHPGTPYEHSYTVSQHGILDLYPPRPPSPYRNDAWPVLAVYSIGSDSLAVQIRECQDLGAAGLNGPHSWRNRRPFSSPRVLVSARSDGATCWVG